MKIKFFRCLLCLCAVAVIWMQIARNYQKLIPKRFKVEPICLKSYIFPYYKKATFRATQPSPRLAFIALSEDNQAQENSNLSVIDSVIVIPFLQKS